MFEVGVAYLVEEKGISRRAATIGLFVFAWSLGALCSLSFGPMSGFKIFGETLFGFCDKLTSNFLMSFGSMLFVIFVGWKMKKSVVYQELTNGGTLKFSTRVFGVVYFFIRYIAPVAILAIFVTNLLA
jgi:NSS family neurotransmitter:Na+ symporter